MNGAINNFDSTKQHFPKVAIIVLNWNGWKDTIECLESLQQLAYPNYQIIVVDNGSTDNSVDKIKAWARGEIPVESKFFNYNPTTKPVQWIEYDRETAEAGGIPKEEVKLEKIIPNRRIILIQIGQNLGFAAGNNVAIRYALKKNFTYMLLLNNDTIVEKSFLMNMISRAEENQKVGIVGCKIYYANDPHRIWYAGGKLSFLRPGGKPLGQGQLDIGQFDRVRNVTFVTGAAMLVKREVFLHVGLLDERFFFGMEDYDFCRRVLKVGYRLLYTPTAVIWHKVGMSRERGPIAVYNGYKTSSIYMKKHLSRALWVLWFCIYSLHAVLLPPHQELSQIDRRIYRKATLWALKEGFLDTRITREDLKRVQEYFALLRK